MFVPVCLSVFLRWQRLGVDPCLPIHANLQTLPGVYCCASAAGYAVLEGVKLYVETVGNDDGGGGGGVNAVTARARLLAAKIDAVCDLLERVSFHQVCLSVLSSKIDDVALVLVWLTGLCADVGGLDFFE